jgi:hypothetical protein
MKNMNLLQWTVAALIVLFPPTGCGSNDKGSAHVDDSTSSPGDSGSEGGGDTDDTDSIDTGESGDTNASSATVSADVTAVSVTGDSGAYTFAVTVSSADIDCSQYADWWEVVKISGELIYRRILAHSHTDENGTGNPFTRDGGPVAVEPDDTVVVRAHMNTAGYTGRAIMGSVIGGFTEASDLADDFAADIETAAPQPTGCAF